MSKQSLKALLSANPLFLIRLYQKQPEFGPFGGLRETFFDRLEALDEQFGDPVAIFR